MKNIIYLLAMVLITLPVMNGTALGSSGADKAVIIRFGYKSTTETDQHKFFLEMSHTVEEKTGGRIAIQLYPNGSLGENKEVVEQARLGSDVMGQTSPGDLGEYVPDYGILPGPYLFDSWDQFKKLANSDLVASWNKQLTQKAGIQVVGYMYFGIRDLYLRNPDVATLGDLTGLKIRVQPIKIYTEMIKSLGAVPTPLPWTEVYSALSQGVIDGAEAPPRAIYDYKHNENTAVLLLDNHIVDVSAIYLSDRTLTKLSANDKEILLRTLKTAIEKISQANIQSRAEYISKIKASGVKIIRDVDREAFKKAASNVYKKFPEWTPNLYQQVQDILNK